MEINVCTIFLSSEYSDSWIVITATERSCQQNQHNGAMTVKCVEMLEQQRSKQRDKNGGSAGSDLPEGIVLPVNSIASMQTVEPYCCKNETT